MKKNIATLLTTALLYSGGSAAIAAPLPDGDYQTAFVGRLLREPARCLSKSACRKTFSNRWNKLKIEIIDYLWEWPEVPDSNQSDKELKVKLHELERALRESGRHNPDIQYQLDSLYDLLSKPKELS